MTYKKIVRLPYPAFDKFGKSVRTAPLVTLYRYSLRIRAFEQISRLVKAEHRIPEHRPCSNGRNQSTAGRLLEVANTVLELCSVFGY